VILPPIPLTTSLVAFLALGVALAILVRLFFPRLARSRPIRRAGFALAALLLASHGAWAVGLRHYPTSALGADVASLALPCLVLLVLSVPVAALVHAVASRAAARTPTPAAPAGVVISRRQVVQAVTAGVPLAAVGTGVLGLASDVRPPFVRRVVMPYTGLPRALEGLRILQLSDLHLGCSRRLDDLERVLDGFASAPPDLLVLTGDIAEDVDLLAPALRLAASLRPRYGAFASLGNHEYLRDIKVTRRTLERGPIPLLVSAGHEVRVGDARVHIAGADDPVIIRGDIGPFLRGSIDAALDGASSDAFHLLLSHRPEGFDVARARGIELTLAGHTHGGQIGVNGKSAFEPLYPDGYLWGSYARGRSRLYTTSGFGDWYPFRLGCPTEAALVVLTGEPGAPREEVT
jgi:predicted MPP superfamily phosphohydrolase